MKEHLDYSKWYTMLLFLFIIIQRTSAIPENSYCCARNQSLIKFEASEHSCFDSTHNKTESIWLKCKADVIADSELNFTVNEWGELEVILDVYTEPLAAGLFCVGNETSIDENRFVAVICSEEEEQVFIDDEIVGYCMAVSAVFFALCAVIYAVLPELRDLQGKSIINYCISMALGLALLASLKLLEYTDLNICAIRAFLTYFFIIAAFFWMNAISVQILLNLRRPTLNNYEWKEFIWYALYTWGTSAILTIAMAIVNYHPGKHRKPGIGLHHCWFFSRASQWYYMYSVMSILIVTNIFIFIYTSILLWKQSFSSTHIKALRFKFTMTLKTFIVMGLPWIFEMISSVAKRHFIWDLLDLFNALEGPLIFLILIVLRQRVIKALHKRGLLFCFSNVAEKYLAAYDDEEDRIIEHTTIPLEETK